MKEKLRYRQNEVKNLNGKIGVVKNGTNIF